MSCVLFDFDSTLITRESMEEFLAPKLQHDPRLAAKMQEITDLGMAGEIAFGESLQRRLALAEPTLEDVARFGQTALQLMTAGMPELVSALHRRGIAVFIVSGGMREAILPVAQALDIPPDRVHAVRLKWTESGQFGGIDPDDGNSFSKLDATRAWIGHCSQPRVMVGDGMTDYQLYQEGLTTHFVAFTANIRRQAVVATGAPEAENVATLSRYLEQWV